MTGEQDCMHPSLRIEPGEFVCSRCGTKFDRKPPEQHLADMRAMLHKPVIVKPKPKGEDREDR